MLGKTERRVALVILLTALLTLASAMVLAYSLLDYASSVWLRPEVDQELERGIELYKDYVRTVKDDMKHQTDAMTADDALRDAARRRDAGACALALDALFPRYPALVSLSIEDGGGRVLAAKDRGRALDEVTERKLEVTLPISGGTGPVIAATFAFDRRYEQRLERAGAIYEAYSKLADERTRAAGTVQVRVPVTGSDELTELARTFNRMLGEMQQSRARIEYLQRIGAWQEMAQRLAHEIKNPLTPIQLAVQQCHRKYEGHDAAFR